MRCQFLLLLTLAVFYQYHHAEAFFTRKEYQVSLDQILDKLKNPPVGKLLSNKYTANIDKIIDANLVAVRETLKDPAELKNKDMRLTRHIFFALSNGVARKVSQIDRTGPCTLSYQNKKLQFAGNFGWSNLDFDYSYQLQVLFLKKHGVFLGNLDQVRVRLVLDIDIVNRQVILRKFEFTEAGKVVLKVEGQRIGDKLMNVVLKVYTFVGRWSVLGRIQSNAVESIQAGLDELNELLGKAGYGKSFTFVNEVADVIYDVPSYKFY